MPEERLAAFRKEPDLSLRSVRSVLTELSRVADPPGRVIWCLENRDEFGLTRIEAEAIFSEMLTLELVREIPASARRTKLLVVGRLREEHLNVSLLVDASHGIAAFLSACTLEWLHAASVARSSIILFVDHPTAQHFLDRPRSLLASRVGRMLSEGGAKLGLWIPRSRVAVAVNDPRQETEPLRVLSGRAVRHVRFEDPSAISMPAPIWSRFEEAQFQIDSSTRAAGPRGRATSTSPTPYLRGGAFWPQPFDLTALAATKGDVPLEIVSVPVRPGDLDRTWRWRIRRDIDRLRPLVDYVRVTSYDQELAPQLRGAQVYHEYRVHNWPASPGSPRVTFFDAGTTSRPIAVARVFGWCARKAQRSGPRWRLVSHVQFDNSARREADARLPATDAAARHHQAACHTYLDSDPGAPLREDARAFLKFIPSSLGATLEIGSGYGQFARALAGRSTQYICLDLDPGVVGKAISGSAMSGGVGDIHALPFRSCVFDSVIANNVIEHAYDPVGCLGEIRRILSRAGRLFAFIPLDALNPDHELPAHYWKADEGSVCRAMTMAGLRVVRTEVTNLYELGVRGAFPSCYGLVCQVEAAKA
jgi:SAM-dependent methyltransferase